SSRSKGYGTTVAEFNGDRESHRQYCDRSSRSSGKDESDAEERRHCPEGVPGVGGDEPWQGMGVTAGADPESGSQGDQNDLDQRITSSSNHDHHGRWNV